ncbi:MAG: hypothetical protein LBE13_21490 [Bacteroidales bacterium]|jgi:hypothetical protein|nr:hypothetical protein [Bacteroidales bacterium]
MNKSDKSCKLININELKKDPKLQVYTNENLTAEYKDLYNNFGILNPIITNNNTIVRGIEVVEAARSCGKKSILAYSTDMSKVKEFELRIALTKIKETTDPLTMSVLLNEAINNGITRKDICQRLKKSKAWLSKILMLDNNLNTNVKDLVSKSLITTKAATYVGKIPEKYQLKFAKTIMDNCLNTNDVKHLTDICMGKNISESKIDKILDNVNTVLDNRATKVTNKKEDGSGINKISKINKQIILMLHNMLNLIDEADILDENIKLEIKVMFNTAKKINDKVELKPTTVSSNILN